MRFKIRVRPIISLGKRARRAMVRRAWHRLQIRFPAGVVVQCGPTVRKDNFLIIIIISLTSISTSTAAPAFAFAVVRVTAALLLEELRPNGLTDVLEEACGAQAARAAATASAEEKVGLK